MSQKIYGKQLELVTRKEIYPYEYMNSFEKFDETKLPNRDDFYSSLKDEHVSDKNYDHALEVWHGSEMNAMGDYHDLYLRTNVLLLADVFEGFRNFCL